MDNTPWPLKPVGQTDVLVSPITYGTVKFGRNQGMKYPAGYELPSDQTIRNLLAIAKELGINALDTAPAYGTSETRLGAILGTSINDWVICTKVGEEFENGQSAFNFSAEHTRNSVHRSLKRLGRDILDIVMIHSNGDDSQIVDNFEAIDTLQRLKADGLIRAIGMSTKTVDGALQALPHVDCLMVTYNQSHTDEVPVLEAANTAGKGIFIKKALASGHIVHNDPQSLENALTFVVDHPAVTSITLGTITEHHLRTNAAIVQQALKPQ